MLTGYIVFGLLVLYYKGAYPRLDFIKTRNADLSEIDITINGSNQFIKYLIKDNADDKGFWVCGAKIAINLVIARYNNDSGIQLLIEAD